MNFEMEEWLISVVDPGLILMPVRGHEPPKIRDKQRNWSSEFEVPFYPKFSEKLKLKEQVVFILYVSFNSKVS